MKTIEDISSLSTAIKNHQYYRAWCTAFVHYCFQETTDYKDTNSKNWAAAYDWLEPSTAKDQRNDVDGWPNGESCDAFVGAVIIFNYSHVAFIIGQTEDKLSYVYLGGNQGGAGAGKRKITKNKIKKDNGTFWLTKPKNYTPSVNEKELPILNITDNTELTYENTH